MDMSQYRELFFSETREHLVNFNDRIHALGKDANDREAIDSLFRSAHSIKGMAASMGFAAITEVAHRTEDLMEKVRKRIFTFDPGIADLLLQGADILEGLVEAEASGAGVTPDTREFIEKLVAYDQKQPDLPPSAATTAHNADQQQQDPRELREESTTSRPTVRVRTELLDNLINLTGELITNKHRLVNLSGGHDTPGISGALAELSRLLRGLHNEVLNVRMMPFSSLTDRFPRIVRDLARRQNKEVAFEVTGKEIELDRGILEGLADPLIHILRNGVDHGLESGPERLAAGKDPEGKLLLSAVREKDHVVITVADDGKGMDPARLVAAALEKGIITPRDARALSPRDVLLLTCHPGFSTTRDVTDISGRGVGMDVVRSTVRSLGGSMQIDSQVGTGTIITLKLPLTVAIIDVLLIHCAQTAFAVPVNSVTRTMEISRNEIISHGRHKFVKYNDAMVPLLSMNRIMGFDNTPYRARTLPVMVSEVKGRDVALVVDSFRGHQEVFVKPLGRPLDRMKGLMGGAIVGNGEVIFILDVANLI